MINMFIGYIEIFTKKKKKKKNQQHLFIKSGKMYPKKLKHKKCIYIPPDTFNFFYIFVLTKFYTMNGYSMYS